MYIKKSGFIKALFISTIHKILFEKKLTQAIKTYMVSFKSVQIVRMYMSY